MVHEDGNVTNHCRRWTCFSAVGGMMASQSMQAVVFVACVLGIIADAEGHTDGVYRPEQGNDVRP